MFCRDLEDLTFNGVFVPLFSSLQTFPFLRHPSEKRPIEVRIFEDSLFFTLFREICQALCSENTCPAVTLLYLGPLQHEASIIVFPEASKCSTVFFTEALLTICHNDCQFCKKSYTNEPHLWGGHERESSRYQGSELIAWRRRSDRLSPVECYCCQSVGCQLRWLQCHSQHLVAWEQNDYCVQVTVFNYDFCWYLYILCSVNILTKITVELQDKSLTEAALEKQVHQQIALCPGI